MKCCISAKFWSLGLVLAGVLWTAGAARAADCYVLAIGVDQHLHGDKLKGPANLGGLAEGARRLARTFHAQAGTTFGKVQSHVLVNADATRANIRDRLQIIAKQGKAYDYVILYFSGHGGGSQAWGFTPYDADYKNLAATGLPDRMILDAATELASQGKTVVLIVDSCQSGSVKKTAQDYFRRFESPPGAPGGMIVMVGCGSEELSIGGLYTGVFLEAMAGDADADKDRKVTVKEIQQFTRKRITEVVARGKKQDADVIWTKTIPEDLTFDHLPAKGGSADPLPEPPLPRWKGKTIVPKFAGLKIDTIEDGTRTPVATLEQASYRVLEENRGLILVATAAGVTGWLEKVDAVPLDEAAAYFTEQIRNNVGDTHAYLMRALVRKEEGRLALAIKDYTEAISQEPKVSTLVSRASTYYAMKAYERAIDDFTAALKGAPTMPAILYGRGLAYLGQKEYELAIEDFNTLIELRSRKSGGVASPNVGGDFIHKEGRYSVYMPRKVTGTPGNVLEMKIPGSAFSVTYRELPKKAEVSDDAAAQKRLNELLGPSPDDDQKPTSVMLGKYYGQERTLDLADGWKVKLRAYLVGDRLYEVRYRWLPGKGGTLAEADSFLNSFKLLSAAEVQTTSSPGYLAAAYNGRGDAYLGKQEYLKAIDDYTAALKLERKQPFVLNNRGLAHFLNGDYESALKDFDASEALDPENAWVFKNRARLLATAANAKYRDGKKAVEHARKALELERYPGAEFHETLAAAYAEAGDFAEAARVQDQLVEDFDLRDDSDATRRLDLYRRKQPFHESLAKGINAQTVAAYEKLGGVYGGWLNGDLSQGFQAGQKFADAGLPGFQFKEFPAGKLPEVSVAFGLDFVSSDITDAEIKDLAHLRNLTALSLALTAVSDAGLKDLAPLKRLTSLALHSTAVGNAGLKDLSSNLALTALYLGNTRVTDDGLRDLAALKALTTLDLAGTKVTNFGLRELATLKNLTSLTLLDTRVSDAGMKELTPLKNLSVLNLFGTQVSDAGLKDLAAVKTLTRLSLGNTKVGDAGLKELGAIKGMVALDLYRTQVTDMGLKHLTGLKGLTVLDLGHTRVSDAGLKDLAMLRNLTGLNLRDSEVTAAGVETLSKALPRCEIVH